jgi:hypothetical protein
MDTSELQKFLHSACEDFWDERRYTHDVSGAYIHADLDLEAAFSKVRKLAPLMEKSLKISCKATGPVEDEVKYARLQFCGPNERWALLFSGITAKGELVGTDTLMPKWHTELVLKQLDEMGYIFVPDNMQFQLSTFLYGYPDELGYEGEWEMRLFGPMC